MLFIALSKYFLRLIYAQIFKANLFFGDIHKWATILERVVARRSTTRKRSVARKRSANAKVRTTQGIAHLLVIKTLGIVTMVVVMVAVMDVDVDMADTITQQPQNKDFTINGITYIHMKESSPNPYLI